MHDSLLPLLVCPVSGQPLTLVDAVRDEHGIQSGRLATPEGRSYPIEGYVPRFAAEESYARSFGKEWNLFSRVQLDSANGTTISRTRFVALTGMEPEALRGRRVLEAGCGSGRFLEVLASAGAEVVGVDMSAAIGPCERNLRRFSNVNVVCADLNHMPFWPGSFDFVYSFGVLMCTPDTRASFLSLVPHARPGGEVCVWVYGCRGPRWLPRPYQVYGHVARGLPDPVLNRAIDVYAKVFLPLGRLPLVGSLSRLVFPISDLTRKRQGEDGYDNGRTFPPKLVRDWARLNTYDAFTPQFTRQHSFAEVCAWFAEAGLTDVRPRPTRVAVLGRRPPQDMPTAPH